MNLTRTTTTAEPVTSPRTEPPPPAARAHRSELVAGALAALGAIACVAQGIIEIAHGGLPEKVTTASEHAGLALFAASLVLVIPAVLALGRRAGRSRPADRVLFASPGQRRTCSCRTSPSARAAHGPMGCC